MNIKNIFFNLLLNTFKELKNRILFLFFYIFIFRILNYISIPGVNIYILNNLFKYNNNIINIFNILLNNNLLNISILSLNIIPYISSSIIIQLLIIIFPYFIKFKDDIYKKYKINKYIKYLTLLLSIIHSIILFLNINKFYIYKNIILNNLNNIIFIISLITGTMFLIWLAEQISENSLGNGISVLIFINIISNFFNLLLILFKLFLNKNLSYMKLFLVFFFIILIIYFIIFIEISERKILILYSSIDYKNIKYFFSSYNIFLPFKINMSGVISFIFTSNIILFFSFFLFLLNNYFKYKFILYINNLFYYKNFLYLLIYIFFIIFFCFFYNLLMYNSNDISNNLNKSGAYIYEIRPGKNTSFFLKNIILKLTLFNSLYILIIYLYSNFIYNILNIKFNFNNISLLIVIIVFIDFITQIKSLIISNNYFSILKKYN